MEEKVHQALIQLSMEPTFCLGDVIFYNTHSFFKKHNFGRDVRRFVARTDWCIYHGKYYLNARGVITLGFFKKKHEVGDMVFNLLNLPTCKENLENNQNEVEMPKMFSGVQTVAPREEPNLSFLPPPTDQGDNSNTKNNENVFMPPPSFNPRQNNFNNEGFSRPTNLSTEGNGKEVKSKEKSLPNNNSVTDRIMPQTSLFRQQGVKLENNGGFYGNSQFQPVDNGQYQPIDNGPNHYYSVNNNTNMQNVTKDSNLFFNGKFTMNNYFYSQTDSIVNENGNRVEVPSTLPIEPESEDRMTDRSYISEYESDFLLESNESFFVMMNEDMIPNGNQKDNHIGGGQRTSFSGYFSDVSSIHEYDESSLTSDFDEFHLPNDT